MKWLNEDKVIELEVRDNHIKDLKKGNTLIWLFCNNKKELRIELKINNSKKQNAKNKT